jgi:3-oxoacyl-ACP reductase-like protein
MTAFRRVVVALLLSVWAFPAVSWAKAEASAPPVAAPRPAAPRPAAPPAAATGTGLPGLAQAVQLAALAAREKQARELQDFRGGESVSIYIGGGALTVVAIILLIVLLA